MWHWENAIHVGNERCINARGVKKRGFLTSAHTGPFAHENEETKFS